MIDGDTYSLSKVREKHGRPNLIIALSICNATLIFVFFDFRFCIITFKF